MREKRGYFRVMLIGSEAASHAAVGDAEPLQAVADLKSQYCQRLDAQEWDGWEDLFTEDGVMQIGPSADSAIRGRRAIRRLLATQLRGARTLHQARNPEVRDEGPDHIQVLWEMNDRVSTRLYLLEGAGFYEDKYLRTSEGWKIASVRLHRSKVDLQAKSFLMRAILRMHRNGWLRRLAKSADRTLTEALHVSLPEGQRPN